MCSWHKLSSDPLEEATPPRGGLSIFRALGLGDYGKKILITILTDIEITMNKKNLSLIPTPKYSFNDFKLQLYLRAYIHPAYWTLYSWKLYSIHQVQNYYHVEIKTCIFILLLPHLCCIAFCFSLSYLPFLILLLYFYFHTSWHLLCDPGPLDILLRGISCRNSFMCCLGIFVIWRNVTKSRLISH